MTNPVVRRARIAPEGGRLRTYAFCQGDYAPLDNLLTAIAKASPVPAIGRGRPKQVTMEQIEQIKTQRKPRKRAAAKAAS